MGYHARFTPQSSKALTIHLKFFSSLYNSRYFRDQRKRHETMNRQVEDNQRDFVVSDWNGENENISIKEDQKMFKLTQRETSLPLKLKNDIEPDIPTTSNL